jgi:hypothetical protein
MRDEIRSLVESNLKRVHYEEKVGYYESKFDEYVQSGMSEDEAFGVVKNEVVKLNVRRSYLISSVFFPVLSVVFIALSMMFPTSYTWVVFPIGLNVYLYFINVDYKYILLVDVAIVLLFLYFYLWIMLFGFDLLFLAFVFLYFVFMIIMFAIKQFKFDYVIWPSMVMLYFTISLMTQLWAITWIVFPLASAYQMYKNDSF